jgi:hypothetical protein
MFGLQWKFLSGFHAAMIIGFAVVFDCVTVSIASVAFFPTTV